MKICTQCGKEHRYKTKKCYECYSKTYVRHIKNCYDCGKEHSKTTVKCSICYQREWRKRPENEERSRLKSRNRHRKKVGIPLDIPLLRAASGSGHITKHGYRLIYKPNHPNACRTGRMLEHTFIMSEYLNRPLRRGETVHHKNGIRHDNRIENLELRDGNHGVGQKVEDLIQWCHEFLPLHGYQIVPQSVGQMQRAQ